MRLKLSGWPVPDFRAAPRLPMTGIAEIMLVLALAAAAVALFWAVLRPLGSVGRWQAVAGAPVVSDPTLLSRFDPFFRNAGAGGPTAVTSLSLKLFGIRLDQAMGRGSAIIATPDGVQSSYGVGDEIVPGVKLKSVAFDYIVLERGGVDEQLFLDQSVAAQVAGAPATASPGAPATAVPPPASSPLSSQALAEGVSFAPRIEKGAVAGFVVAPKGSGAAFAQTGLVQGDIVKQINGREIRSADDVAAAAVALPPGGKVNFLIERNGTTMNISPDGAK